MVRRRYLLLSSVVMASMLGLSLKHLPAGAKQNPLLASSRSTGAFIASEPLAPVALATPTHQSEHPRTALILDEGTGGQASPVEIPINSAIPALEPRGPATSHVQRIPSRAPDESVMDTMLVHGWAQALYQNHRPRLQKEAISTPFIALTFDDGPKPVATDQILNTLKARKAHATFFLVGKQCARYPAVVSRIVEEGHEIANHTYDHHRLPTIPIQEVVLQLERNRALLRQLTGQTTFLFRPPGGRTNPQIQTIADSLGYTTVFWRLDSGELCANMNPDKVFHRVVDNAQNGDIILLHNGDPNILAALPRILDALSLKGFEFVTVSEMMRLDGARPVEAPLTPGIDIE